MKSSFYIGSVHHHRIGSVEHQFQYPVFVSAINLMQLPSLDKTVLGFSYNKFNVLSLYDKDYGYYKSGSILEKFLRLLNDHGIHHNLDNVVLITNLRLIGYAFNPVSFYYGYSAGQLKVFVAEVNNTFGERYFYILDDFIEGQNSFLKASRKKSFHVSPFYSMKGNYDFYFTEPKQRLTVKIHVSDETGDFFRAFITGEQKPFDSSTLKKTLILYPFTIFLTMPRILWQAAKLHYQKRLPVFTKPNPTNALTLQIKRPSWFETTAKKIIFRHLQKIQNGHLRITLPDRTDHHFGNPHESPVTILVHNYSFFVRTLLNGDIGFGEAYVDGDWDTDNLTSLIEIFIRNTEKFDDRDIILSRLGRWINRIRHSLRNNSHSGSKQNIHDHYDLSNRLFKRILDPTMMYSSGFFTSSNDTLEDSQHNKINMLIEKLTIQDGQDILEIGSGWGTMAIEIAKRVKARITSITLSEEQLSWAKESAERAGVSDRVTFKLCDYRDIKGQYDRIISIEMLEAVGHKYLSRYFYSIDQLLKPSGICVIQVITIPDYRYETYRKNCDWIQKHIFPGSLLPSLTAISEAISKHTQLMIHDLENIGIHYSRTLELWRTNLKKYRSEILQNGFDETFIRKWDYYFSYCEAAFQTRTLNDLQLVITRPNNLKLNDRQIRSAGLESNTNHQSRRQANG